MTRVKRLALGDRIPTGQFGPITQTDIVRFAGAGGDFNPLHHDGDAARQAGFEAPIAMGQFTAALVAGWLTDWCGVENLHSFGVRFIAPVKIGDILEFQGEVVALSDAGTRADLELSASVGSRDVTTATASIRCSSGT